MSSLLTSKKANSGTSFGATLLIGVILFNILMYVIIYFANQDSTVGSIGNSASMSNRINQSEYQEGVTVLNAAHWYDGFNVSVFNLPWWVNIFYVTFQGVLVAVSIYAMLRG